jgi:hypothetical protein
MAYIRKTKDEYNIISSYDHGKTWDIECTEETYKEAKEQRYLYVTNCTYGMYRIQKRRVKI